MKHFNKLFGGLAAVLAIYLLVVSGFDLGHHNYQMAVPNLIMAAFWIFILFMWSIQTTSDAVFKVEMEALDSTRKLLEEMLESQEERQKELAETDYLGEMAQNIYREVTDGGGKAPTPEQAARIEKEFHHATHEKWFLKIQSISDTEGKFHISQEPIESDDHPAQDQTQPAARKQISVIDGDAPVAKPPTKAQQRRRNDKVGKGPFTDDELREHRNAKRRADRAAKKAELKNMRRL